MTMSAAKGGMGQIRGVDTTQKVKIFDVRVFETRIGSRNSTSPPVAFAL